MPNDLLTLIAPGIHYPSTRSGPLLGLCDKDGSFGSPEFVTCPVCRLLILYALEHYGQSEGSEGRKA